MQALENKFLTNSYMKTSPWYWSKSMEYRHKINSRVPRVPTHSNFSIASFIMTGIDMKINIGALFVN